MTRNYKQHVTTEWQPNPPFNDQLAVLVHGQTVARISIAPVGTARVDTIAPSDHTGVYGVIARHYVPVNRGQ